MGKNIKEKTHRRGWNLLFRKEENKNQKKEWKQMRVMLVFLCDECMGRP